MNADQCRAAINRLHMTQKQAAELFGAHGRTGRKWVLGETKKVPTPVAILLRLLLKGKISIEDVERCNSG